MKIVLTKKLGAEAAALFHGIDAEWIDIREGDADAFHKEMADADAVLLSTAFQVDAATIEKAKNLKVISRTGVGVDNVDVHAATAHGIMVLNTPAANAPSVAEHALAFIGALAKQFMYYDPQLRGGNFKVRRENKSIDLEGKTLGLIGCGQIGRRVARKCEAAYNMMAIGYDPFIADDMDNIKMVKTIEEVMEKADVISLHLPLNDDTRGLIGADRLALVKPTAFIINTSRGGIICESALAQALQNGKIAGAAIDVFEAEPPAADSPLLQAPNTILTPHSAALTEECTVRVAFEAAKGIADFCRGVDPQYIFNRMALHK